MAIATPLHCNSSTDGAMHNERITITPNNRLANYLINRTLDIASNGGSRNAVIAPQVYSLSTYIKILFDELQLSGNYPPAHRQLLTEAQLLMSYLDVIRQDKSLNTIIPPTELAAEMVQAHRRLTLWEVDTFKSENLEQQLFLNWRGTVKARNKDAITEDEAVKVLMQALLDGHLNAPKELCLFSFDDIPPLHQQLFDAFSLQSEIVIHDFSVIKEADAFQIASFDAQTQITNASNWAFQMLTRNPEYRIAIVVPDLVSEKDALSKALDAAFEPQAVLPQTPSYTKPYNFSLGSALIKEPIVETALTLLSIGTDKARYNDVLNILRSPFIGDSDCEMTLRAKFDHYVRQRGSEQLSLIDVLVFGTCPALLAKLITAFVDRFRNLPERASMGTWMEHFEGLIKAAGWPGERNLTSEEYQALNQFIGAMRQISVNFGARTDLSFKDALFYVKMYLKTVVFAPETEDSPIQVLGLLEAAGLPFDAVMVLDVNEGSVPCAAAPNPFIPEDLQIELNMPHASASRELDFFESVISRLRQCSKQIVYSFCKTKHEKELTPSIFAQGSPLPSVFHASPSHSYEDILYKQFPLKTVIEEPVPVDMINEKMTGGVSLLKYQAACPYAAFSKHRLRIDDMPEPIEGISAAEIGDIVHDALCFFWRVAKSQSSLLAMQHHELNQHIDESIEQGFQLFEQKHYINRMLRRMEKDRVRFILSTWMEIEKAREPFIVEITEYATKAEISGIELNLSLDRVDIVQDVNGAFTKRLVIDYKTGAQSLSGLSQNTLRDPQLPVYTTAKHELLPLNGEADEQPLIHGVAYGNLKRHSQDLIGITQDDVVVGANVKPVGRSPVKLPSNWSDTLALWTFQLEDLAKNFLLGQLNITPSSSSCQFCSVKLVCRHNKV